MRHKNAVQKRFVATRMSEVRREKLQWLWPERIALGTLTVLAGDFGSGKSLLAADLAARVSRGDVWPDGRLGLGPSEVLVLNHQDSTLLEMLEAAGADTERVVTLEWLEEGNCGLEISDCGLGEGNAEKEGHDDAIKDEDIEGVDGVARRAPPPRPLSPESRGEGSQEDGGEELEVVKRRPIHLQKDLDVLEEYLQGMENCRLVVVDPVDAHMTGGNTVAARMWLRSLATMAAKHQVAMVLVTRLKDGRKSPLDRLAGGAGLASAARTVWMVAEEGQESGDRSLRSEGDGSGEPSPRRMLPVKNNLSGERSGLAFRLVVDEGRDAPRVEWLEEEGECEERRAECGSEASDCGVRKKGNAECAKDAEKSERKTRRVTKVPLTPDPSPLSTGARGARIDAEEGGDESAEGAEVVEEETEAVDVGTSNHRAERDANYRVSRATWIAVREKRRKLAQKKRRTRRERKRQRKLRKPR